jgi:hypothetical protein
MKIYILTFTALFAASACFALRNMPFSYRFTPTALESRSAGYASDVDSDNTEVSAMDQVYEYHVVEYVRYLSDMPKPPIQLTQDYSPVLGVFFRRAEIFGQVNMGKEMEKVQAMSAPRVAPMTFDNEIEFNVVMRIDRERKMLSCFCCCS